MEHRCPICRKLVKVPPPKECKKTIFFPFCSSRCKLIDLGGWLDATYKIVSEPRSDESSETPEDCEDAGMGQR
ncbi:MAG: DNA gyrase inhibitor YacG [Planctomycetota bacterium]